MCVVGPGGPRARHRQALRPQRRMPVGQRGRVPEAMAVDLAGGPGAQADASWALADWVIPGPWNEAIKELHSDLWKPALA